MIGLRSMIGQIKATVKQIQLLEDKLRKEPIKYNDLYTIMILSCIIRCSTTQ